MILLDKVYLDYGIESKSIFRVWTGRRVGIYLEHTFALSLTWRAEMCLRHFSIFNYLSIVNSAPF